MFEQTLDEMNAMVFVSPEMFRTLTASNVGVSRESISIGYAEYSFREAVDVVGLLDKALLSCPKYLRKRILAQRMSFVFAFGPDMEDFCGIAPKPLG